MSAKQSKPSASMYWSWVLAPPSAPSPSQARIEQERIEKEKNEAQRKAAEEARSAQLQKLRAKKRWLAVTVEKVEGLKNIQITGTSDPLVKVRVRQASGSVMEKETVTRKNKLDPTYGETFTFELDEVRCGLVGWRV